MKTEHQVVAVWNLNYLCNLECPYCFFALEKRKNPDNNRFGDTDKVIDFFNKTGRKFLIRLCGGEPFLYPDFIGLCRALTEKNQISVSSNLTGNLLYDFSERINPESVEMIDCSLHIVERERLNLKDDFCEKVNHLKQKKFHLRVTQVMYPPAIKEFDRTFDYFNKRGITI
ncbi:MAG: radical SAM protein, partial [bacterium]